MPAPASHSPLSVRRRTRETLLVGCAFAALLGATGCGGGGSPTSRSTAARSSDSTLAASPVRSTPSSCPVTKPRGGPPPRRALLNLGQPIAKASDPGWYGNGRSGSSCRLRISSDGPEPGCWPRRSDGSAPALATCGSRERHSMARQPGSRQRLAVQRRTVPRGLPRASSGSSGPDTGCSART
jgi:hypothetical protein